MKTPLLALPLVLLLIQCHKDSPNPAKPEDQLPAATQTGANTFGCLVNGQPYTPKGNVGVTNFAVFYEPFPNGAGLNILTYRVDGAKQQFLNLGCGLITPQKRTFTLDLSAGEGQASYEGSAGDHGNDSGLTSRRGTITITRLDEQAGIIAGTFEFTSVRLKGDTLKVTQGRFDSKL
jgi:hypothetical protein